MVEQLARGKAEAVTVNPVDMLVSADTIIYANGQVRVGIVLLDLLGSSSLFWFKLKVGDSIIQHDTIGMASPDTS